MSLKVYYDMMSQPCRALVLFLKINDISYIDKPVAMRKGENHSEEYSLLVNPFNKVPAIVDGHFRLTESVAILKYLCSKYDVADHWYPADLRARARVDEYMAWQHMNTRFLGGSLAMEQVMIPRMTGNPVNKSRVEVLKVHHANMVDQIENVWLKTTPYIAGSDVSLADILAICELQQVLLLGMDVIKDRPILSAWVKRVENKLQPHLGEVNKVLFKAADNYAKKMASAKL